MTYRLLKKDRSVGDAVRRIADEQIGKALASIEELPRPEAIHDVRKRCKKVRGLIHLVRPALASHGFENAAFRDTARQIGSARDAAVMARTWSLVMGESDGHCGGAASGGAGAGEDDLAQRLADARFRLTEARERASGWKISEDGWKAIGKGLKHTFARARNAAAQARANPDGTSVHELRKQTKYHWHHCMLLQNLWPDMMRSRKRAAFGLSEILGDHHDLQVLIDHLAAGPQPSCTPDTAETAMHRARKRQAALLAQAWPLIDCLYSESPRDLGNHLKPLWTAWRKRG